MIRLFFIHLSLIAFFLSTALLSLFYSGLALRAVPVAVEVPQPIGAIMLIPLDSRPPCTDYVEKLGRMAGYKILLPPVELLDDYTTPGNSAELRRWFLAEAFQTESAIISIDMLVHGGLWASRQGHDPGANADETLKLLTAIHQLHPHIRLFAFNIIPRLFIAERTLTTQYRDSMAEWSILQDTFLLFENPQDLQRLQQLEQKLPADLTGKYRNLYTTNRELNLKLIKLVRDGVLSGLVVGQDDSAPFGLGNLERRNLESVVQLHPELRRKVFITRGTDEVALTLLKQATRSPQETRTKVYVHYTEPHAADLIMPYMPGPLSQTVAEKLDLLGAITVETPADADYILVIHAGNTHSQAKKFANAAAQIKNWLDDGKNIALVDLATDWIQDQTLLPLLQANGSPLYKLIAYAGWNTASNSIGTAVTQAEMVLAGRSSADLTTLLSRNLDRISFLAERISDDWYYQKSYRASLNNMLLRQKINPYALGVDRTKVGQRILREMTESFPRLVVRDWCNARIILPTDPTAVYTIADWKIVFALPWERTFEIRLDLKPIPALIQQF